MNGNRHRPSRRRLAALALAITAALMGLPVPNAAAAPADLTVEIRGFIERDCPEDFLNDCPGDYYAEITIDGNTHTTMRAPDNTKDIDPRELGLNWQHTVSVDSAARSVEVNIAIYDVDHGSPNDEVDISAGDDTLHLKVDMVTGVWREEVPDMQPWSEGSGEDHGYIHFDIRTPAGRDTDGDGVNDGVELTPEMVNLGADPCRKSIFLEIDYMTGADDGHTHKPHDEAIAEAKAAMDAADTVKAETNCPYAGFPKKASGIGLGIDISDALDEQDVFKLSDLPATRDAKFSAARRPWFHYIVFAHNLEPNSSVSGRCCADDRDFIVTLGEWGLRCVGAGADGKLQTPKTSDDEVSGPFILKGTNRTCDSTATGPDDQQWAPVDGSTDSARAGSVRDQSGTILHELGHSLGLGHGGRDKTNRKPNYLSVMNYSFSPEGVPQADGSFRLDYSKAALPDLDELELDEEKGIGDGTDGTYWVDAARAQQVGRGDTALDWNGKDGIDTANVAVDLNNDDACVLAGSDGKLQSTPQDDDRKDGLVIRDGADRTCDTPVATGDEKAGKDDDSERSVGSVQPRILTGFEDWGNISYRGYRSGTAFSGGSRGHEHEITYPVAADTKHFQERYLDPDVQTAKTVDDPAPQAGQTVNFDVRVSNVGTGPARQVSMTDTMPDGTRLVRTPGSLEPDGSASYAFPFTVPCDTPDAAVLTNTATSSGVNVLGGPDRHPANNTASASVTVERPVLTVVQTATGAVNAGEAITYTITYENAGTGDATDVTVSNVLPAEVYYSEALDLGAGPRPTSVTRNADGTTTLAWDVGSLSAQSGVRTIEYSARPSLLFRGGETPATTPVITYAGTAGCTFETFGDAVSTLITVVPPSGDPRTIGYYRNHPAEWSPEFRARIQATDQRYDTDSDGLLSTGEVEFMLAPGGGQPKVLQEQLLAVLFNLSTRRINAATVLDSKTAQRLGLSDVADAARYGMVTLESDPESDKTRYSDATRVLDEINNGRSVFR